MLHRDEPSRRVRIAIVGAIALAITGCSPGAESDGSLPETTVVLAPDLRDQVGDRVDQPTDETAPVETGPDTTVVSNSELPVTVDADQVGGPGLAVDVLPYIDWSAAGAARPSADDLLAEDPVLVDEFGAVADDGVSDSAAFAKAVVSARRSGDGVGVIEIPPGRFLLTETLELGARTVLRGSGRSTVLEVDLDGRQEPGIMAEGSAGGQWSSLPNGARVGSATIAVANPGLFAVGAIVEFEQDNNETLMNTDPAWDVSWGDGSVGELGRITAVEGSTVRLESALNSNYEVDLNARIRVVRPIEQVGLESMTIERSDDGFANTVTFRTAVDVWVHDVETVRTNSAHIGFREVYRCSVTNSVIHGASDFGDGGRAYGISLGRHASDCLVMNNTLFDLRHAIIIQLGASGNVVAYNDARGSAGYEDRRPRADLSLHGHWPQANLFEGNIFDRVFFADWWGPVGPGNTLFRSCVADYVIVADHSNDQAVVNNAIGDGGFGVDPSVERILSSGNQSARSADKADSGQDNAPPSLWTDDEPNIGLAAWPPFTPNVDPQSCRLPATEASPFG